MNIKATLLASVLSIPLVAGAALAADTGNQSLITAVKQGRQADVQSILNGAAKQDIVATQGGAALIWAASHNDKAMVDLLLAMLDKAGVPKLDRLGDSTGRLDLAANGSKSVDAAQRRTL